MLPCQLNIAIDGPAGAGKSSVAREVAQALGLIYLDTGAMYRAITWKALDLEIPLSDKEQLGELAREAEFVLNLEPRGPGFSLDGDVPGDAIRSEAVTAQVSLVSSYEEVRRELRAKQRALASGQGVIMEGRDIGTAVMPDAQLKIFLTASEEVRAERRIIEYGLAKDYLPKMQQALAERDYKDSSRQYSPLAVAEGAIVIDSTGLSLLQVVNLVIGYARAACLGVEK